MFNQSVMLCAYMHLTNTMSTLQMFRKLINAQPQLTLPGSM